MARDFIEAQIARGRRNTLLLGLGFVVFGALVSALLRVWTPAALLGFLGLLILWLGGAFSSRYSDVYNQLALYGDPRRLAQEVNGEFAGVKLGDGAHFGERWLACTDAMGMRLAPWSEIVWLYCYEEVRNRIRRYYVKVSTREGRQFSVPTKSYEAEQLAREMHARAPWAELGYSNELDGLWDERRAEFVRRVDARRGAQGAAGASNADASPTGVSSTAASSTAATPAFDGERKGLDFRAVRKAVWPVLVIWVVAVVGLTLARQSGVVCATPLAWTLALWVGLTCVSRSRSKTKRALLAEAAVAGGVLGLAQGVLFFLVAHFAIGGVRPEERQKALVLDLIMLVFGTAVAALLSTAAGAARSRRL